MDVLGPSLPFQLAFSRDRFIMRAGVFGIKVFRTGDQAAQITFATIQRPGNQAIFFGRKTQRSHGLMGLNGMPEQITGTEFGAEAALVTCRSSDPVSMEPFPSITTDQ